MKISLNKYIANDSTLDVFYNGLKAVISHDVYTDVYNIIILEHFDQIGNVIPIPKEIEIDTGISNIIFPRCGNVRLYWNDLIKLKTNEIQF